MAEKIVIGIAGKTGSGKSTVADILSVRYGFNRIDVDEIGHRVLDSLNDLLIAEFGDAILDKNGKISRDLLGNLVFPDQKKLDMLNSITHPLMYDKIVEYIENSDSDHFTMDAALLFQMGLDNLCNYVIYIEADEEILLKRIQNSKGWSGEKTTNVLKIQANFDNLKLNSDFIMINNGGIDDLNREIDKIMKSVI